MASEPRTAPRQQRARSNRGERTSAFADELQEVLLGQETYTQLLGSRQLTAGVGADNQVGRPLGNRRSDFAAQILDASFGLAPRIAIEPAGEHELATGKRTFGPGRKRLTQAHPGR